MMSHQHIRRLLPTFQKCANQSSLRSSPRARLSRSEPLSSGRFDGKFHFHSLVEQRGERILVTGAAGQVGHELVPYLRSAYGETNVIASDVRPPQSTSDFTDSPSGMFHRVDVLEPKELARIVTDEGVGTIVHLAAVLSARGEKDPLLALKVNNEGTQNVLESARTHGLKVFCPSTIAVFGPSSPKHNSPDDCVLRPTTMYGITKVHSELLGEYYHNAFDVDFRSLRYPGVISTEAEPGFGTTDYAVEIYREATQRGMYTSYLQADTALPMIYMPDLLRATLELMEADPKQLHRRTYNLGAMSFTPREVGDSIRKVIPDFRLSYKPDFRQQIAESWPASIDYTCASADWGWKPEYGLDEMTTDILQKYLQKFGSSDVRSESSDEDIALGLVGETLPRQKALEQSTAIPCGKGVQVNSSSISSRKHMFWSNFAF